MGARKAPCPSGIYCIAVPALGIFPGLHGFRQKSPSIMSLYFKKYTNFIQME
jgi:hypothetical protein